MKRLLAIVALALVGINPFGQSLTVADSPAWNSVPGPAGGSVAALVMSPDYAADHIAFAGLRGQGVYRNTDGGYTWQPAGLSDQVIIDLAISPNFTADHTLFAATGLGDGGYQVYRSTDGGVTWQSPYVMPYEYGFKALIDLSISPDYHTDHTVYALGETEMYKSTDGGLVFVKAGGWFASHSVTALVFSPAYATDHTLFAASPGYGVMKSIGGGIWATTSFDVNSTAVAVSPNYATDQTLAVINALTGQVLISTDGGATQHGQSLFVRVEGKHTLLFSPTFAADQVMLAASSGDLSAYRSTDNGETWLPVGLYDAHQPYGGFVGGGVFALALSPKTTLDGRALAGTSTGIYTSNDWGGHWTQSNAGLSGLTVRSLAIAPNDPRILLAGTSFFEHKHFNANRPIEADGNLQLSTNNGQTWQTVIGLIDRVQRVAFSPDFANDHRALAVTGVVGQDGYAHGGIYRSFDGGVNWEAVVSGGPCAALAISPDFAVDQTAWVYMSGGPLGAGVLRSTDRGETWAVLNTEIVAETIVPSSNYAADHVLFASTSDGRLQKSIDGGEHWTPILNHPITALAISPVYGASQTLFAGVQDLSNSSGEIYRSGDGGAHWQMLNTGIPSTWNDQPATINAIEFAIDGSILAGITYGDDANGAVVYRSIDGGQTWSRLGSGLNDSGFAGLASLSHAAESDQRGAFTFLAGTAHALARLDLQQRDLTEPGAWNSTGPYGGRADVLAVSPNFAADGVAFTGESNWFGIRSLYGRGIFKSTDGGQTWRASSNGTQNLPASAVAGIAFSPNFASDQTVFFASWSRLFKSTDGGENWQPWSDLELYDYHGFDGLSLAPNYPTSGHLVAWSRHDCVYRSADFGEHWSSRCDGLSTAVIYSPNFAADNTLFSAGSGVRQSVDGGLTWTPILTAAVDGVAVSPHYGVDHTLFASGDAFYTSTDGGTTWLSVTLGISTSTLGTPAISPAFATDHTLFVAAGNQLYRSTDGGLTWYLMPAAPNVALGRIVLSPGWPAHPCLLIGTAQGVYRSIDGGDTWARMPGLTPLATSAIAHSADDALWLTGTTNGVYASQNAGRTWSPFGLQGSKNNVTVIATSPDFSDDHTAFAILQEPGYSWHSFYRTTDGGATWNLIYRGGQGLDPGSLAISPQYASDRTLFAGTYDRAIIGSTDGGDTWQPIGTWPPGVSRTKNHVAVPPNYPADSTIFAAGSGFWRLPPGETLWQPVASGILTTTDVLALAVAPNYTTSHTVLAATSELLSDYTSRLGVFRSDDGGVNWQPSDIGLPEGVLAIAFSPHYADDHTVYAATRQQLYRSIDEGHRWSAVASPPDEVWLGSLGVNRTGEVFVTSNTSEMVNTSSTGVWQYTTGFRDVLIDGDAEAGSGWSLSSDGASYATEMSYHAQHSLRLGLAAGSNRPIDSFAAQTVTLPISATFAQLNLRLYPVSSESDLAVAGDAQYVTITPSDAALISTTLLSMRSNAQMWQPYSFDLTRFAGQTLVLRIGVLNDGLGEQTAMYVDNASLIILGPTGSKVYLPIILKN